MHTMFGRSLFPFVVSTLVLTFGLPAFGNCTAPLTPGVRICAPTPNATEVYVPMIDFNTTPSRAAHIVKFKIYDNNRLTLTGLDNESGGKIIDGSMKQGFHDVVINAWDSSGKLFQGRISFSVVANGGSGFPFTCPLRANAGINFCAPTDNSVLGVSYQVTASAKGTASIDKGSYAIKEMRLYVDGVRKDTQFNVNQFASAVFTNAQGNHTVAVVAWDTSGAVFNSTRILKSSFKWSWVNCPPKGTDPCSPGISTTVTPEPNSYTGNTFDVNARVLNNPSPITAMKAYVDNQQVASSTGPVMMQSVSNAPSGTHVFTIQAWDTKGLVYRVQYNVNINVSH